jgi:uroporphyrinogen decarboxylase
LPPKSKKNTDIGVRWLEDYPDASQKILDLLTAVVIEYMSAQVDAGAHMLQVFEAMGMMIDDANFEKSALPALKKIATELRKRHPGVPLMVFCRGACHLNDKLTDLGYHVITIDGSVDRGTARSTVGPTITLQGNYDPAELIEENGKTAETVRQTARELLDALGPARLIANLGEGLGGKESPELVNAFVTAIHEESAAMLKQ